MTQTIEHYTVKGHWPFPLDMMRRDGSVAATDTDAALIERLSAEHVQDAADLETQHVIRLRMADGPSRYMPNDARWRSFGWAVVDPIDAFADASARERRMEALRASALSKLTKEEIEALEWHGLHASH